MDPVVEIYFGGVLCCQWEINGPSMRHEMTNDQGWLPKFAGVTFHRVVDNWLTPALGLSQPPYNATGVELRFANADGVETYYVRVKKGGYFSYKIMTEERFKQACKSIAACIEAGNLYCTMHLITDEESWGQKLCVLITENVLWTERKTRAATKVLSIEKIAAWVTGIRASGDADTLALALALLENTHKFLKAWPTAVTKKDLGPWKKFVTEVVGHDLETLTVFCPRRLLLDGYTIVSTALDPLGPLPRKSVNQVLATTALFCQKLAVPFFSAEKMFAALGKTRATCAATTVFDARLGSVAQLSSFYLDEQAQEAVFRFIKESGHEVKKHKPRQLKIMGVVTRVERWTVDFYVTLDFVEKAALLPFDKTLEIRGVTYMCQADGAVATHAIARLMKIVQEGQENKAQTLRREIRSFHDVCKLGFPVIGGKRRNNKRVYFSDYNRTFYYKSDKSISIPDEAFSLSYSRHMHENVAVDIWT
jgi:hypothetical protein